MKSLERIFTKIDEVTLSNMKVENENGELIYINKNFDINRSIDFFIRISNENFKVFIRKDKVDFKGIIEFIVEEYIINLHGNKNENFAKILDKDEIVINKLIEKNNIYKEEFNIIVIDLNEYIIDEAAVIVEGFFKELRFEIFIHESKIIIITTENDFEYILEDIRNVITSELMYDSNIIYGLKSKGIYDVKNTYLKLVNSINVGKIFKTGNSIYKYDRLFMEKIAYNLDYETVNEFRMIFGEYFKGISKDIYNTIEVFINSNLNISETSKKLFIHRNTLIYRLDSILKETNYDIRKHKDASVFYIAFLLDKKDKVMNFNKK